MSISARNIYIEYDDSFLHECCSLFKLIFDYLDYLDPNEYNY